TFERPEHETAFRTALEQAMTDGTRVLYVGAATNLAYAEVRVTAPAALNGQREVALSAPDEPLPVRVQNESRYLFPPATPSVRLRVESPPSRRPPGQNPWRVTQQPVVAVLHRPELEPHWVALYLDKGRMRGQRLPDADQPALTVQVAGEYSYA